MMKNFSTGISSLDTYLGGIRPGDSLVAVISGKSHSSAILTGSRLYAESAGLDVAHFTSNPESSANRPERAMLSRRSVIFSPPQGVRGPDRVLAALKRFAGQHASRSLLLVDELSTWKSVLRRDERVTEMFSYL